MQYSTVCAFYLDFLDRRALLTSKLLKQWFLIVRLKAGLQTNYRRYHELVDRYRVSISQLYVDLLPCENIISTILLEYYYWLDFDYG